MPLLWQALSSHFQGDRREADLKNQNSELLLWNKYLTAVSLPLWTYQLLPLAGLRRPVNKSLLLAGKITISINACFAFSRPAVENLDEKQFQSKKIKQKWKRRTLTNIFPFNRWTSVHYCCIYHFNQFWIITITSFCQGFRASSFFRLIPHHWIVSTRTRRIRWNVFPKVRCWWNCSSLCMRWGALQIFFKIKTWQ